MTKAKWTSVLTSLMMVLAVALNVQADQAKPKASQSQTYAVLVGISEYADQQIKPRPHAEADVKALYDLFTNKDYLGLDDQHIRLLLGKADEERHSQPATHDNIIKALRSTVASAGSKDLIIFAFVGQGAPLGERTCYFASDSTFKDRLKNAVAAADIEHELEKLKKNCHFCAFIDLNLKGFDPGKDSVPEPNLGDFVKQFFGSPNGSGSEGVDSDESAVPLGRVLFLASNRVAQPIDLEKHGLFTQVILDGLKGAADKEGYEPDGVVTVDELMAYLEKEAPALVRKYGKTKEEKEQSPLVWGARSSHFNLTKNPAVIGKVQERLDKFAKLVEENKVPQEFAEEGQNLLHQMPKLEALRTLRKKYQELADGKLAAKDFEKERTRIMDGMKLKRTAAVDFAGKVMDAIKKVQQDYVKAIKQEDLVVWAIKGLYQHIEVTIPSDIKKRLDQAKDLGEGDLEVLLADAREKLGKREDLDNHKDLDIALVQMLHHCTDPYTTYIDAETKKQFDQDMSGRFPGIGVQIRKDYLVTDMLLVVTPIKDSPAYKAHPLNLEVSQGEAGLKAGDIITQVIREVDSEGKPLDPPEVLSTKGMLLTDAVKKIKGKAGTKVKLTVQRKGFDKLLEFEITRAYVEIESVVGVKRNEDDTWDYMIDPDSRIAYIRLNAFTQTTDPTLWKLTRKGEAGLLPTLTRKGIKGLILDLRFNPGGLLGSAVKISDMFIDDGLIVKIKDRAGNEEAHMGRHDPSYLSFPMVCLVNGYSASGSEIVAACLQDHNRARIVGERTYGKGSVQNVQPFEEGELKLTIASFWRPNGKNLNKLSTSGKDDDEWGVMPDKGYLVKLSRKERDELAEYQRNQEIIPRRDLPSEKEKSEFKDRQLEKALEYLRGQIKTAAKVSSKKAG